MAIQVKPLTNTKVKAAKAANKDLSLYDGGGYCCLLNHQALKRGVYAALLNKSDPGRASL